MVKSIGSQDYELDHVAWDFQGKVAGTTFRCIASKSRATDQINAYIVYMRHAKSCRVIRDLISQRERAGVLSLAGFVSKKAPARQPA